MRDSDVVVVWKLDRLSRTMKDLVDLAANLSAHCRQLIVHIIASIDKVKRDLTRQRTNAALAFARRE